MLINPSPQILDSTLKLNRYWNFRGLIDSTSNSLVATMLNKKNSYISAISGPNPVRAIGDQLAAEIERAFRLPHGSIDATPDRRISNEDAKIADVARMMMVASDLDKDLIVRIVSQVCGHSTLIISELNKTSGAVLSNSGVMDRLAKRSIDIQTATGENEELITKEGL